MADENESGQKTEEPTARRRSEARGEGQVGVSLDLSNVCGMTFAFLALQFIAPLLWQDFTLILQHCFTSKYFSERLTIAASQNEGAATLLLVLPHLFLLMLIAAVGGAGCSALQTQFLWSWKLLKPRWLNINPINGFKRIFSINNLVNLLKSIAKLCIIAPITYLAFRKLFPIFLGVIRLPLNEILRVTGYAANEVFWRVMAWLLLLAILDLAWQKWRMKERLKMTKQEVRDERKATEGDETTRRRILAIGLQRARNRMMKAVPTADVVVTNPTHIAVALVYTGQAGEAPKVVAKGRGFVAQRIKDLAQAHGVPVIERKPLAQALFKMVEVGQEIPYELFKAVAEILAYVYRLKGKMPRRATGQRPRASVK